MATIAAWLLCIFAIGGIFTTLVSVVMVLRFARRPIHHGPPEPVSLLKPLHGLEPRLAENLQGFFDQDWGAPIQMVAGVQRAGDPARAVVAALAHRHDIAELFDPTPHGPNAKIANLINMAPAARHDLIVISDSDMAVPRDYLRSLTGELAQPGVGAVSCLYHGRGATGFWSVFSAAGTSYHFLPSVVLGLSLGLATPCMGSTIALRRETLDAIGGFRAFADVLADDYEIGAAVRALGQRVVIPSMLLVHDFSDTDFGAMWRHELRWHTTLRTVDPGGNAGLVFTYPLPFALALVPFMPRFGALVVGAALVARYALKRAVDRWAGVSTAPAWLLPLRDCLSLAQFVRALVARSVEWRGAVLKMETKGRVSATPESHVR